MDRIPEWIKDPVTPYTPHVTNRGTIPKDIGQINFVLQQWSNPCDAPWYVYLETAGPAALQMAISLLCWDWADVARWFFRPVGKRAQSHFRGRKKGHRRKPKLGWAERARKITPGMSSFGARSAHQGVHHLWRIDGVVQRLLWYWVVYEVVRQGVYNYTSMLYRTEYCQAQASESSAGVTGDTTDLPAIAGWVDLSINEIDYVKGNIAHGAFALALGPGKWIISSAVTVTDTLHDPTAFQSAIDLLFPDHTQTITQGAVDIETAKTTGTVNFTYAVGPLNVRLKARCDTGFVNTEQMLWVMQRVEDIPGPDRQECALVPIQP